MVIQSKGGKILNKAVQYKTMLLAAHTGTTELRADMHLSKIYAVPGET